MKKNTPEDWLIKWMMAPYCLVCRGKVTCRTEDYLSTEPEPKDVPITIWTCLKCGQEFVEP